MSYDLQDIIARREARQTWTEIAKAYGVGRTAVSRWVSCNPEFPRELLKTLRHAPVSAEDLQEMVDEGLTDRQIGDRLGIPNHETVARLRSRRGVYREDDAMRARRRNSIPEDELAVIKTYVDEGYPIRAIEKITGVTWTAIKHHFPHAGLSKEEDREMRAMSLKLTRLAA